MSSNNQWNLVTKSKKQKNLEKKVEARQEQKRVAAQLPKLEEILPSHKISNLLNSRSEEKIVKVKPTLPVNKKRKEKYHKEDDSKKQPQNNHRQHSPKTKPSKAKPQKSKNFETAVSDIKAEELSSHLAQLKVQFPNSRLLWLKGVATFFNSRLPFDCDPTFNGKSIWYPRTLLCGELRNTLNDFFESVGDVNLSYFYQNLLDTMANELNSNLPVLGYKILLQAIGIRYPHICAENMAKTAMLRNSYQNRPHICLSIFWAIGQGGHTDFMSGIQVWRNLMLPNLEMKHYSEYVSQYVYWISSGDIAPFNCNQNEFFEIFRILRYPKKTLPFKVQETLEESAEYFMDAYIDSCKKHANIFLSFLREIECESYNRIELAGCLKCLSVGDRTDICKIWIMNYKKQMLPTLTLLRSILTFWMRVANTLLEDDAFERFLNEAHEINMVMVKTAKGSHDLDQLISTVEILKSSMQKTKKQKAKAKKEGCGCCKWVLGSFLLLGLTAGVLVYDTQVNGKGVFEKSATGKVLKNAGLLPYVEKAWYTTMGVSARGYKWAEKHVPPHAAPVIRLTCDLFKLTRTFVCNVFTVVKDAINAKLPQIAKFIEHYVPGLPNKIEDAFILGRSLVVDMFDKTVIFFQTQVLVGRLSPENLGKALNHTQNLALEYYSVFSKKVDIYAKLK